MGVFFFVLSLIIFDFLKWSFTNLWNFIICFFFAYISFL